MACDTNDATIVDRPVRRLAAQFTARLCARLHSHTTAGGQQRVPGVIGASLAPRAAGEVGRRQAQTMFGLLRAGEAACQPKVDGALRTVRVCASHVG